jgi:hypothetical protein
VFFLSIFDFFFFFWRKNWFLKIKFCLFVFLTQLFMRKNWFFLIKFCCFFFFFLTHTQKKLYIKKTAPSHFHDFLLKILLSPFKNPKNLRFSIVFGLFSRIFLLPISIFSAFFAVFAKKTPEFSEIHIENTFIIGSWNPEAKKARKMAEKSGKLPKNSQNPPLLVTYNRKGRILEGKSADNGENLKKMGENCSEMHENRSKFDENRSKMDENWSKMDENGENSTKMGEKSTKLVENWSKPTENASTTAKNTQNLSKNTENRSKSTQNTQKSAISASKIHGKVDNTLAHPKLTSQNLAISLGFLPFFQGNRGVFFAGSATTFGNVGEK